MRFRDRTEAGRRLAEQVRQLALTDPVVLALPRGGVPVGFEVAAALGAPLEVFVARKIGAPGQRELGIGAIAEGDGLVANDEAVAAFGLTPQHWDRLVLEERRELERRVHHYRGDRPLPDLRRRDVVLVDDGLATGVTAEAALRSLRRLPLRRLVLAVPACAPESAARLGTTADEVVCVVSPQHFLAVGQWYEDFRQTGDDEVLELLARAVAAAGR